MENITLTLSIIIITCLVSITSFSDPRKIHDLSMIPTLVKERKQYYRFLTSGLVHADWLHLGFNMITLWSFGGAIESIFQQLFGSKIYYLGFYLLALILSDIPTYLKHRNDNYYPGSVGASGAISAIVFSSVLFAPWTWIRIIIIPIPLIIFAVIYLGYTMYMARKSYGSGINHDAHLYGALFGLLFPIIFKPEVISFFLYLLMQGPTMPSSF